MTYIDYLNEFNRWIENNHLTLPAQVLYFRLLNVFNRAGWPEWVPVDTIRLQVMTNGLSKPSAYRARDELVKAGFIRYQQGKKGAPSRYSLSEQSNSGIDSLQETLHKPLQFPLQNPLQETLPIYKTKTKTKEKTPTESKRKVFVPPTVDEVREYCLARKNGIDPQEFVDYYAARGWMLGKAKMKDWKAAVRTWEKRRKGENHDQPERYFTAADIPGRND